jgi:hypothetical protein
LFVAHFFRDIWERAVPHRAAVNRSAEGRTGALAGHRVRTVRNGRQIVAIATAGMTANAGQQQYQNADWFPPHVVPLFLLVVMRPQPPRHAREARLDTQFIVKERAAM